MYLFFILSLSAPGRVVYRGTVPDVRVLLRLTLTRGEDAVLGRTMASRLGLPDHGPRVTGVTDPWECVRKVSHVPRNLCSEHNSPAALGGLRQMP